MVSGVDLMTDGPAAIFSTVVPANAGTHTAESIGNSGWQTPGKKNDACGNGSRIALGFTSLVRDDVAFDQWVMPRSRPCASSASLLVVGADKMSAIGRAASVTVQKSASLLPRIPHADF
jgi:hypothetical protein